MSKTFSAELLYILHALHKCLSFCRQMTWWSSEQSNMINGTDGSVFHTFLSRDELLYIFAADLCRYATCGNLC